jgi:hypothetical protein
MALCYHWRWKDATPNGQTRMRQFHYSDLCLGTAAAAAAPLVAVGQRRGAGAVHLGERRRVAVACTDGLVGTAAAVTKAGDTFGLALVGTADDPNQFLPLAD